MITIKIKLLTIIILSCNYNYIRRGRLLKVSVNISTLKKNIVNFNKYLVEYHQLNIY